MDNLAQDFDSDSGSIIGSSASNGGSNGKGQLTTNGFDAVLYANVSSKHRPSAPILDVEAAYKDLNAQLAKVGRKEIERRISFGRTAARNRAILRCVADHVGSSPSELQERLIEILTVDFMDTPITDMEIIQALK